MRFTTGQEPGDRAELGHDRLPENLDESMMAASGCTEPVDGGCVEENSMISNLPLLFAEGYPTSLEKITMVSEIVFTVYRYLITIFSRSFCSRNWNASSHSWSNARSDTTLPK